MKKTIFALFCLSIVSSVSSFAYQGDLDQGIYELNRGAFKAAINEFEPLVAQEYSPAQYQMALIYLNGYGVTKDPKKALELMSLAASQNHPDALFSLSLMYSDGVIVKKDLKTAFALMERAAIRDSVAAQFNLGVMYFNGTGTYKDYPKAARWYETAAKQNYALAQFNLALMYFEGLGVEKSVEMSFIWNIISASNGYQNAGKSRDMDSLKLSNVEIAQAREKADRLYQQIIEQEALKAKQ
ncbi:MULTISPECIES: tetratricopeptide repeat protein [unclassified Colwellia]|jgi:TPR repeat protein|uniref:tetratricopeptide repeat protein n=1 Tax=unclassified Colwellia TaxID=196834 RepID=UPI0015F64082|nr:MULTISPECIES: tetratricopeptide repeat protein [unclassified Colwellia]MBA6362887.1 sel1 repeat family protein [Colwellia sp. BRX8-8]MBA6337979.1 sel1 repeat family protein [Colwellia sp. BRX8-7]MBA6346892.1 sel1 repeat family protein [Colwellia sp. BRX8-9]MBA6350540.1 sel1 repeat family protein [Colwellia sp. BRX9-1]MBA6355371.1 sel1 repeat family protein [Colwellia sp. BRX8-3]|tara:strand:+ start:865 stop:1587 length:723 start_codon:yes stop_codon:yes gene_type:complete